MQRLLALDWLRGFFICFVIFFHALGHLIFINAQLVSPDEIRWYVIALFAPLILLSTWAPIFALISGAANSYVLYHLLSGRSSADDDNGELRKSVKGIWLNSGALYIVSILSMGIFHYGFQFNGAVQRSWIVGSIEEGRYRLPDLDIMFYSDAIAIIAMSGFLLGGLYWALWRNGGWRNKRRNYTVLVTLGCLWFAAAVPLRAWLEPVFFQALLERNLLLAVPLKFLIGPAHATFPNAGFAFFGAVLGLALADGTPFPVVRRFGYRFGLFFVLLAFVLMWATGFRIGPDMLGTALPMPIHLMNLGLMLALATFLLGYMEYQRPERRVQVAATTIFVRRFGLLAMTVYVFESLICVINMKWYLPFWLDQHIVIRYAGLFGFAFLHLFIWYAILKIWERYDFKYSLEWLVVTVVGRLRGRESARLNVAEILYRPVALPEKVVPEPADAAVAGTIVAPAEG